MKNTNLIKQMVDKFLSWKLPKDFSPDGAVQFNPIYCNTTKGWKMPTGTNLLNANQAKELFEYLLEGEALYNELWQDVHIEYT